MSDVNIPGVTNNNIDTEKMIKAIMDAERVPLTRMESELETFKKIKKIWQDLNLTLSKLRDSANGLFSFNSPFSSKKAVSSNEEVVTATVTRKAVVEDKEIIVKQVATADRFMSESLPKDFKVKAGTYTFQIGDKEISIAFHGGSLSEFVDAINKKGGKYLRASVVNDTKDTQVIVIESLITGSKNRLVFKDDAISFAEETRMIKRVTSSSRDVPLGQDSVERTDAALAPEKYSVREGELTVSPQTELQIPLRPPFALNQNMVLEYEVRVTVLSDETATGPETPPGPSLPDTGSIEYKGIRIYNEQSIIILPETETVEPPKRVDDMRVLFFRSGSQTKALPDVRDSGEYYKVSVPIGEMASSIDAIVIQNKNTHRSVSIRGIRIIDPTVRGDYAPTHPISEADDAVIEYNGIQIIRETNEISDLIPEVTLQLHEASEEKVKLSIRYDTEAMKEAIITFVGNYNRLITEIDILTRADSAIVEAAVYLDDDGKEKALERLGILNGDTTLMQLKSALQTLVMNAYKTSGGQEMALLAQIGISTNARSGSGIDKTLLRGYLQIDEDKLDAMLKSRPEWVRELFGNDLDGDLVIDSGVGFAMDARIKPYVTTGGIIGTRLSTLDSQMVRKQTEITNFQRHLEDFEQQLRTKYGNMQALIEQLEKSRKQLENFNTGNK